MIQHVKKILSPIDFSPDSMEAMRSAYDFAQDLGAAFHVVHVVAPVQALMNLIPLARDAEKMREFAREAAMVQAAEEELAHVKKEDLGGSRSVVTSVLVGPPALKLAEYARQNGIDMIVMATKGRTGAEHLLMGSVAEKLVRTAPCSVMVLRRKAG